MLRFNKSLDAESSNVTGEVFRIDETGEYNLAAYGEFDTAVVKFFVSFDELKDAATNGFTDDNVTFAEIGGYNANLYKGCKVWAELSSVGGSTSVTAVISAGPIQDPNRP